MQGRISGRLGFQAGEDFRQGDSRQVGGLERDKEVEATRRWWKLEGGDVETTRRNIQMKLGENGHRRLHKRRSVERTNVAGELGREKLAAE